MKKNNISPEYPDFWNQKYINNDDQWDIGSPTPIFVNWAKTLSYEVAPYGITVNNILPGLTNTGRLKTVIKGIVEMQNRSLNAVTNEMKNSVPSKRFAEPSETASAITFLASDQASYINGINLPVDGGRTQSL